MNYINLLAQVVQCCRYDCGQQRVTVWGRLILSAIGCTILIAAITAITQYLAWLDFLYYVSYVKLAITLIKYIPQVFYCNLFHDFLFNF